MNVRYPRDTSKLWLRLSSVEKVGKDIPFRFSYRNNPIQLVPREIRLTSPSTNNVRKNLDRFTKAWQIITAFEFRGICFSRFMNYDTTRFPVLL